MRNILKSIFFLFTLVILFDANGQTTEDKMLRLKRLLVKQAHGFNVVNAEPGDLNQSEIEETKSFVNPEINLKPNCILEIKDQVGPSILVWDIDLKEMKDIDIYTSTNFSTTTFMWGSFRQTRYVNGNGTSEITGNRLSYISVVRRGEYASMIQDIIWEISAERCNNPY